MVRKKNIEDTYKEMDEITHILTRPGMWVGSVKEEQKQAFVYNDGEARMTLKEITYIPAMLKIFDEVLSNSCDEFRRKTNMGLTKIEVTINNDDKTITVRDNGGIPVAIHKTAKCYVPEFIFGRLRTSSNYDDTEDRAGVGQNGVGSALANVFSSRFTIETADKSHLFHRSWIDNMRKLDNDLKVTPSKEHYTKTTFSVDFSKFDTKSREYSEDFVRMAEKRCIDAAAANPGLKVIFTYIKDKETKLTSDWKFKDFTEYIDLYADFIDLSQQVSYSDREKTVYMFPYPGENPINIGFVNGAECSKGTHIAAIRQFINKSEQEYLLQKKKIELTTHNISQQYSVICIVNVTNPSYNSQTKDELTTPASKFDRKNPNSFDFTQDFADRIAKSELTGQILDWYEKKKQAEDMKEIRKMNRESGKLLRSAKFVNCNSHKASERQLWIYEGDSAATGFRTGRDPQTQASYLMIGVPLNTIGMTAVQVMKNPVFNDIIKIIGLKWGELNKKEDLKFGKIVIASDMDYDGHKIAALLMIFFDHFPELFDQNMICRIISPIIIASKGSGKNRQTEKFYSMEEFRKRKGSLKGWTVKYVKGLGGQSASEYREMMQSDRFQYFTKDNMAEMKMSKWFSKGIADVRKGILKNDVEA